MNGSLGRRASVAGVVAGCLAIGLVAAFWPTFTVAAAAVAALVVLAWRAPEYAFLLAIVAYAGEGTLKLRLLLEGSPLGVETNALGAALLDLALAVAVLGLLRRDRLASLAAVWRTSLATRLVLGAFAAWLVVSVLQIPHGGIGGGVEGFRLVQVYVVAVYGGIATAARIGARRTVSILLIGFGVAAAYAAVRGIVGPAATERAYARLRDTTAEVPRAHGSVFRNVGSFSSAVGLASYFTAGAVLAAVVALLVSRARVATALIFAAGAIALAAAYVRTALVVVLAVTMLAAVVASWTSLVHDRRRRITVLAAAVALLLAGAVATVVAAQASPEVAARTRSVFHPFSDRSMRDRFATWHRNIELARDHPLGQGLRPVHAVTAGAPGAGRTTDNSYLLVLRRQGFVAAALFALAMLGAIVVPGVALVRRGVGATAGFAALCGFAAFSLLCVNGDYVEQPGKTLAWTLLGVALLEATGREREDEVLRVERPPRLLPVAVAAAMLCAAAVAAVRPGSYEARTAIVAKPRAVDPPRYAASLIRDPAIVRAVRENADAITYDADRVDLSPYDPSARLLPIRVESATPKQARETANTLRRAILRPPSRFVADGSAKTPAARGIDRAVADLPGGVPSRPHPLWAALATLAALAVLFSALRLRRP